MSRFADPPADPAPPRPAPDAPPQAAPRRRSSQLLVLGGVGLAAAVAVLAARKVADALTGDAEHHPRPADPAPRDPAPRDSLPPRFAAMDDDHRSAMRARARAQFVEDEARMAEIRAAALRDRRDRERQALRRHRMKRRQGLFADIGGSAIQLASNISTLIAAANAAVDGFQQVSGRTGGIMRDLTETADRLRGAFGSGQPAPSEPAAKGATPPADADRDAAPRPRDRTHIL